MRDESTNALAISASHAGYVQFRPAHLRRRTDNGGRIGLNLTAMIDVVFLLLVYFIVATDFRSDEEIYRLDLPDRAASQQPHDPFDLDDEPLRISVSTTSTPLRPYVIRLNGPYDQPRTFEDLFEFLTTRQINERTTGGIFAPDHPILIEPTRTTQWEHAVGAFSAAARARYDNITFVRAR